MPERMHDQAELDMMNAQMEASFDAENLSTQEVRNLMGNLLPVDDERANEARRVWSACLDVIDELREAQTMRQLADAGAGTVPIGVTRLAALEAENAELREVVDIYDAMESLRTTCVVCQCSLHPDDGAPHCLEQHFPDEEQEMEWRGAMRDHYRMLEQAKATLAALEAENAELRAVVEKLVSTPVFATRLDALLREAATLREHAKAVRRDIEKKLEDAHEMEERALELLRDAQTQVRREAEQ